MSSIEKISSTFLDINRVEVVFELLFVFVRDEGSAVQDEQTFESTLRLILGGTHIPEEALVRARIIYDRTTRSCPTLHDSALRLKEQLSLERPLLVLVFSVLLRLAMDEGMMCRKDRARLIDVFQIFSFTRKELALVPNELRYHFEDFIYHSKSQEDSTSKVSLAQHFEVLECSPESSLQEVRSSYRRLVKKYHPDRQRSSTSFVEDYRKQFDRVQAAYETILQAKKFL